MGRDPDANQAARADTLRRLRQAALELLAERGFAGTSMAALAERAGVSKGLAYHYFSSKQALVEAVVADRIADIRAIAESIPSDLPPADRLRAFARATVQATRADPLRFQLFLRASTDPELRRVAADLPPPDRSGFTQLFRELGATDPALEARFFQASLLGILVQATTSPRPGPEGLAARLVDRLLEAVLPEAP